MCPLVAGCWGWFCWAIAPDAESTPTVPRMSRMRFFMEVLLRGVNGLRRSGRHSAAALRAAAAFVYAFLHVADLLAGASTFLADLRTFSAGVLVVRGADQHEVGGGPADLGASHHDAHMVRLYVLTALLQAVRHRRAKA